MSEIQEDGMTPSENEVEERNFDHALFRSLRPRCVTGEAESHWRVRKAQSEGEAPTVWVDCVHTRSEQEKAERGTPIVAVQDNKTKMSMAKVVPSKRSTTTRWRWF